jgi:hypothetical protein
MTKTSEDKKMVTDHCYQSFSKVLNMDKNDNDWTFLMIYVYIEYVRLIHYENKILHYMLTNGKYKVDYLENLREYIERFHIVNIQVLYIWKNINVVEMINKQELNEEAIMMKIVLNQIETRDDLNQRKMNMLR